MSYLWSHNSKRDISKFNVTHLTIHTHNVHVGVGGGGGGTRSDIIPPKNQISDITLRKKSDIWLKISDIRPPKKINYQISHPLENKISDIKVPPFHPPPPHTHMCIVKLSHNPYIHTSWFLTICISFGCYINPRRSHTTIYLSFQGQTLFI